MSTLSICATINRTGASFLMLRLIRTLFLWFFLILFFPLLTWSAHAGLLTLTWDANTEPHLTGYKVYYGAASRNYDFSIDVDNQATYSLDPPGDQTTYFAVTAYDNQGRKSDFSQEVFWTEDLPDPPPFLMSATHLIRPLLQARFSEVKSRAAGEREIVLYKWNFGDGSSADGLSEIN